MAAENYIADDRKKVRLIDANAMREDWLTNGENEYVYDTNAILDSIDAQPTVDAVEVVRCKNCIYFHKRLGIGFGKCSKTSIYPYEEDFCSYGEKK